VIEDHPVALQLRYLQNASRARLVADDDDRLPGADRAHHAVPQPGALTAASSGPEFRRFLQHEGP
jgi:hypothetical protein